MEDFAVDGDNLDGDFKALLVMRKNKKLLTDKEEKLIADVAEKLHNKNIEKVLKKDEEGNNKPQIDVETCKLQAFSAVDTDDVSLLRSVIQELSSAGESINRVMVSKHQETLLHRALAKQDIKTEIVKAILDSFDESYVCTNMQVSVGGKFTNRSVLHDASEKGHFDSVDLIVKKIVNPINKQKLLESTTVIVPEGQRPRPMTCLHIAAKCGHDDLVSYFIKVCGMSVNYQNAKGDTPILWAANDNKPSTVRLLLSLGADVNAQNDKGSSALHWAARNGYTSVVEVLLDRHFNTDVNIRRSLGLVCPLIVASAMGYLDIVNLLIKSGANLEPRMGGGQTAIHLAAAEGHSNVVMALLQNGANIGAVDDRGNTALLQAASHGHFKTVILLGQCGADFGHRNHQGESVWDFALKSIDFLKAIVEFVVHESEKKNDNKKQLTGNITTSLPAGVTPLHAAAAAGAGDMIKLLIDMKLDILSVDYDERTFLHVAAMSNRLEVIKRFHNDKLCRSVDKRGYTPLHTACEHGHDDAIKLLIGSSDLSQVNQQGQTALHLAVRSASVSEDTVKALVTHMIANYDWTTLHTTDNSNRTALHIAVMTGNHSIIPQLHHLSADAADNNGNSPVHIAVLNEDITSLEIIIDTYSSTGKAVDLNKKNAGGNTPMHIAASRGLDKIVEVLIKKGADLRILNGKGYSVLHELASLIGEQSENTTTYMKVFDVIIQFALHWWCRKTRREIPNQLDEEAVRYKKEALMSLFSSCYNQSGDSVLQHAAKCAATEMLVKILNLPELYKILNGDEKEAVYDVTDLLPSTTNFSRRKRSKVAPEMMHQKGPQSNLNLQTIAEIFIENESHSRVADVLNVSPFKNIVDAYWKSYQRLFIAAFVFHVIAMSSYSYCAIYFFKCPSPNTNSSESIPRPWHGELGLAIGVIWPVILFLYDLVTIVFAIMALKKHGFIRFRKNLMQTSGSIVLKLCGSLYSVFAITWYIMNRLCSDHQDYILSLSFVFGWIYSISFTRAFKQVHHFSIILHHIIFKDMTRFAIIYLFIYLAFAFAYWAFIQYVPSLSQSPNTVLFFVFNWMLGMANFDSVAEGFRSADRVVYFAQILYSAYLILSSIVMLNLLVAMMSDSYADVREKSEVMWTVGSLQLPLELEKGFSRTSISLFKLNVKFDDKNARWYLSVPVNEISSFESNTKTTVNDLKQRVEVLDQNISQLLTAVDAIKKKL